MLEKTTTAGSAVVDGLEPPRRYWAMAATGAAVAMAALDSSIANIALPAIASDLRVSPADVVWVVNVYQIAMVATLLPLAALGEIVGYKRIYVGGLLLFTTGSLACANAWSLDSLLVARVLQGLGASGLMSVNSALIRFIYPSRLLGWGIGLNAMVVGTSITIGPTVASAILSFGPWSWLFGINIPIGVVGLMIGLRALPNTPRASHAFDFLGAVLASACLGLFIVGIGSAAHAARLSVVLIELGGAAIIAWVLLRRQAGHPAPILPIDLFRKPMFSLSVATGICSFAAQGLAFVSLPFYFEQVLGRSQVETGFLMTPWSVVVVIMAPIAGRLSDRYPIGVLGGLGLVVLGTGLVLLAMLPDHPAVLDIVWRMAVCGCGFGFFQSPNMKAMISSAPPSRTGGASGMAATTRMIGQTTGAALTALCFVIAQHQGSTLALLVGAGFAAVGSIISFFRVAGDTSRG